MKARLYLCLLWGLLHVAAAQGQELKVTAMRLAEGDGASAEELRKDLNGDACALVKVQLAGMGAQFEGNVIGDTEQRDGTYWVYMSSGSKELRIKHPDYIAAQVRFADYGIASVKGRSTYVLTLQLPKLSDAEQFQKVKTSAEQGDAKACYQMGLMYQHGQGTAQNNTKAMECYVKSAEMGDPDGQVALGWMYEHGSGVGQDFAKAMKWYRKAADQGNAKGQNNLGVMYEKGLGVAVDFKKAVQWYRLAAEQGLSGAQSNLGWMYESGQGVQKDIPLAISWYRKAAAKGDAIAKEALEELDKK